jgi:hypothetical protein
MTDPVGLRARNPTDAHDEQGAILFQRRFAIAPISNTATFRSPNSGFGTDAGVSYGLSGDRILKPVILMTKGKICAFNMVLKRG